MSQEQNRQRRWWLDVAANILGRALVLAAISELIFVNEAPALSVVRSGGGLDQLLGLVELPTFYLVPAGLLYALERCATCWATVILLGALVGWSIEGALVPAVYEAPPLSFLWTSVAWHAPLDVALGLFLLPRMMARGRFTIKGVLLAVVLGIAWGNWATWTWPDLVFTPAEFAWLAGVVTVALWVGYTLAFGPGAETRCGKMTARVFVVANVLLALIWASIMPILAGLLVMLVVLNSLALRKGSSGRVALARPHVLRRVSAVYLALFGTAATGTYWALTSVGALMAGPDLVMLVALPGAVLWSAALVAALLSRSGRNNKSQT